MAIYEMRLILKVKVKPNYILSCTFDNGVVLNHDLSYVRTASGNMLDPFKKNKNYFNKVFLEAGAPIWPNGYSLCPDQIYRCHFKPIKVTKKRHKVS